MIKTNDTINHEPSSIFTRNWQSSSNTDAWKISIFWPPLFLSTLRQICRPIQKLAKSWVFPDFSLSRFLFPNLGNLQTLNNSRNYFVCKIFKFYISHFNWEKIEIIPTSSREHGEFFNILIWKNIDGSFSTSYVNYKDGTREFLTMRSYNISRTFYFMTLLNTRAGCFGDWSDFKTHASLK